MTPEDLGRYRLRRLLGRGGMGEVWEADDTTLKRSVAVKILRAPEDDQELARARFAREAQIATALRHPNAVTVYDVGEAAGTVFLVMERVEGRSLRAVIGTAATTGDKTRWLREIADALAAMHDVGVIHRDLKPENVIVRPDGTACLVDLGIARWFDEAPAGDLDVTGPFAETAVDDGADTAASAYLPPEATQLTIYDERSEQWAWAAVAYELFAGALARETGNRPLSELGVSPSLSALVARALSDRPADRFADMRALVEALDAAMDPSNEDASEAKAGEIARAEAPHEPAMHAGDALLARAPVEAPSAEAVPPRRGTKSVWLIGALVIAVLAGTMVVLVRKDGEAVPDAAGGRDGLRGDASVTASPSVDGGASSDGGVSVDAPSGRVPDAGPSVE